MLNIYENCNLFEKKGQCYVNTVNTEGVMGKGIAKECKSLFPKNYKKYREYCHLNKGKFKGGHCFLTVEEDGTFIINFATKEHWRNKSKLDWIVKGIEELKELIIEYHIKEINIPKLGCGLGGLNWESQVKPLLVKEFEKDFYNEIIINIFQ